MNSNFEKEIKTFLDKGNIITVLRPEIPYPRWTAKDKAHRLSLIGVSSNEDYYENNFNLNLAWGGKPHKDRLLTMARKWRS